MNPILIEIGPISIYWYSLTMLFAILVGSYIFLSSAKKKGYDEGIEAAELRLEEIKRETDVVEYQKRQATLELRRQNDIIVNNQLIIDQIENSDKILTELNRLILLNRQTLRQQSEAMKAVRKGNYFGSNIEKFMQNEFEV